MTETVLQHLEQREFGEMAASRDARQPRRQPAFAIDEQGVRGKHGPGCDVGQFQTTGQLDPRTKTATDLVPRQAVETHLGDAVQHRL